MATTTHVPKGKQADQHNDSFNKAKETGGQAMDKAREAGGQAMDAARDAGTQVMDKVKDVGTQAMDKAKEAATSVADMASQAVGNVGKKADDLTATAGADIAKWGDALSEKAPHSGLMGQASQAVAGTLRDSGHYLEEAKFSGMANDVSKLVQRHPMPAILIGFGIGFLLGRALKS
jgi:ElaB/YqjD/DUF883 family membrane-anchored ribosome-binding protein